jgi:alpha-glucosidase
MLIKAHVRRGSRLVGALVALLLVLQATLALAAPGAGPLLQTGYTVASPNGAISVVVTHNTANGTLSYRATRNGVAVIDSSTLGINTSVADFTSGVAFVARSDSAINESYSLPGRKKTTYTNRANEMVLRFSKSGQELQLVVRAYDEGMAYRYRILGSGTLSVNTESSAFNLPDAASGWAQNFVVTYENRQTARANFNSGSYGMPVLTRNGNDWMLLAESDIGGNYYAAHLDGSAGNVLRLVPPATATVSAARPFNSPWRMAVIGGLNTIVESTMVENLSTPSQIADTSWIKPGRSAWSWRAGGNQGDYNTAVQYVDAAAAMGWEFYLCDEGWQASWVPTLVNYARPKGVGIILWAHHRDVDTEAEARAKFSQWASWGVVGAKLDFFENDSQFTMQTYEMIARVAAEYKLNVNFHGATKPNGLHRKWPNILAQEGVSGGEQGGQPAAYNITLLFTRNAVGPMDYTPVIYATAGGNNTYAHQTALAVMYTSYTQHYAEHWAGYRDSVARDFLRAVPTIWDETRLLEGMPDQYATMARRRGSEWYIGSLVGSGLARTASIPLSFLSAGVTYTAQIYRDGASDNEIVYQTQSVNSGTVLSIPLRVNGGLAIRISTNAPSSNLPNLAAGKTASADSSCAANEAPHKAVNGSVALGTGDKWCSTGASKWLRVDLGGNYTVSQITVRHAGAGGESSAWNTRDFNLQTSTDGSTWTTVATVTGNTANATTHAFAARSARYVRINITTPASDGNAAARIYELEVYGVGQFNTNAYYRITNRNSGKSMAVQNASLGDTTPVVQWTYQDATTNDEWRVVDAGGGYYALINRWSGKAADVNGAVTTDGATIIQFRSGGAPNQQWQLVATDSGYHRLVSRLSGKIIEVRDGSTLDGAAVAQWSWAGLAHQQWQLVQVATIP